MNAWLSRNTMPIVIVLIASAVVVGLFEIVDAFADSTLVVAAPEGSADDLEGVAVLAGLTKVSAFLAVPGAVTLLIRRRSRTSSDA